MCWTILKHVVCCSLAGVVCSGLLLNPYEWIKRALDNLRVVCLAICHSCVGTRTFIHPQIHKSSFAGWREPAASTEHEDVPLL